MELSEIIESVDILEYISQFCELEQRSDGEYWGLSPLKDENTPSFSVNPDKQRFYDFSSGKGGNVLEFICRYHNCDIYKGIRILKEFAAIDESENISLKRLQATSVAKKFRKKERQQKESKSVILSDDYMSRYDLSYDKLALWHDEGIGWESMKKFQVRYDPVSDRIVYPIRDISGHIINIGGRTIDPEYKTKRLRKYTYFKPFGVLDTIYGLAENKEEILRKKEIILFEGTKSVLMADTWGIHNTGAILTSHLNPCQFKILIRLGVRVVFALDSDVDIRQDSQIKKLLPYVPVQWAVNRRGLLDPKDSPVDKGQEVFETLYQERMRLG